MSALLTFPWVPFHDRVGRQPPPRDTSRAKQTRGRQCYPSFEAGVSPINRSRTTRPRVAREDFLFSGQVRPSAAAAGRRAGPVLAPLRAADPAAAHSKDPMSENRSSPVTGPVQSDHAVVVRPGRPSPRPILITVNHHRSRPLTRPCRDHAAREPGPVVLARQDWPLRRPALRMILRVLRGRDQR
jgi:hypothetical protein